MPAYSSLRYPKKTMKAEQNAPFQLGDAADDVFTDPPKVYASGASAQAQQTQGWMVAHEAQDAQNIYPSSACVFVANLCHNFDDVTLEVEVTKYFAQFGTVFVKIRRDGRQMPFAFCQFTSDVDADNAEKYGSGAMILGRPCRVEKATANSCFIVYKVSGQDITRQEAYNLLSPLGMLDKVYPLVPRGRKTDMPAMVVHYKRYDSYRSVVKAFEGHPLYRVDAFDPKTGNRQHKRGDQGFAQYEKDRRSAYFGNLPMTMTSAGLERLASACGNVVCAEVATKEVPQMGGTSIMTCFGFVEYTRPDSVDKAIMTFHRKPMDGHIVKVERKRTRALGGSQRAYTWHGRSGNRALNAHVFEPPVSAAKRAVNAHVFEPPEAPRAKDIPADFARCCSHGVNQATSQAADEASANLHRAETAADGQEAPATKAPKADVETRAEPATPCLYPVLSPYPPYGFHLMPGQGPALFNSYGQAYYPVDMHYPADMYMHYPAQETPTRHEPDN